MFAVFALGAFVALPLSAQGRGGGAGGEEDQEEGQSYEDVITDEAVTKVGLFTTHQIGDDLYFEIPLNELGEDMLLLPRTVSTSAATGGFVGGGGTQVVYWERRGDQILFRNKNFSVQSEPDQPIFRRVTEMQGHTIIGAFDIETFSPDSSAVVVNVTSLYTSNNPEMRSIQGIQRDRTYIDHVAAFPENIEVEAVQTGLVRPPAPAGRGGGAGAGGQQQQVSQTDRRHWSMMKLPEDPMMPRWHDARVGYISSTFVDYGDPAHRAEEKRFIRRHRLEKANPDAEMSDPVEPIIYWIDPATPEWLKPWVKKGVDEWQVAFEAAGFTNAIRGEYAPTPEEDPDWSMYDLRHSVVYWRPSTVANATGGQVIDPRTGEILKGEVNMYHNVLNLLRNWYFIQVSPLDERAQTLPLPDSLMGRLLEYVVTHEIGHAIGFPHNMKASAQYPADSLRSATWLEEMGHVSTLMDYSRFNYVAQPEDNIPVELLVPEVGPYDIWAVKWGYSVIPGASTPDEEFPMLDEWASMQDTIPWLRFTTSDSPNDPANQTEAVGDGNAVESSMLALRNLNRVMDSLIDVAEQPGQDYSILDELYGNAVSQWSRYMGHVASAVGGAETQERLGTGPRFDPLSEAQQREAVAFLAENALQTPEMFIRPEILWRIEAVGTIDRIRQGQSRVLNTVMNTGRLNRLVEYEALADDGDSYTVAELMEDLRDAVWGELDESSIEVDVYRRNLQRSYVETIASRLAPPATTGGQGTQLDSDVRAVLRGELRELDEMIGGVEGRASDDMTRLHLADVRAEIARILSPDQ